MDFWNTPGLKQSLLCRRVRPDHGNGVDDKVDEVLGEVLLAQKFLEGFVLAGSSLLLLLFLLLLAVLLKKT